MAYHDPTGLLAKLKFVLPDALIDHLARESGFIERERELDPIVFVWTLILGWSAGATRSLAGLARAHWKATGSSCDRTCFFRRFDDSLGSCTDGARSSSSTKTRAIDRRKRPRLRSVGA